jgi:hypothetical protein
MFNWSGFLADVAAIPQIKRGIVWCHSCGRTERCDASNVRTGWPKCCGATMSLDSPEERKRHA